MSDEVDLVRSRIDIVSLIQERVALKRTGKNWKGLCPFHEDRNPSFDVSPTVGRYRCWSCGASGDIFNWVMETQMVDFPEALRILAERAGVALKPRGNAEPPDRRARQYEAMSLALAFFRAEFSKSKPAQAYCDSRGLSRDVVDQWEIGYAPDVSEALPIYLKKNGMTLAECKDLFLVEDDGSGGFYSKFRNRLMFPIRDENGRLVAFGGRALGDAIPKYVNSSDTPLFSKRRVLYGLNVAKEHMAKSQQAVLVEGYLDVIACHRAGVENAVASLGTALSEDHVKLLTRFCKEVAILYDADAAGQKAAQRACELFEPASVRVRVALMPLGEDPDTLLKRSGAETVRQAATSGVTMLDFRLLQLERDKGPEDEEYWDEAIDALAASRNEMDVAKHVERLSSKYPGLRDPIAAQRAIRRQIAMAKRHRKRPTDQTEDRPKAPIRSGRQKLHSAERTVFEALLNEHECARAWQVCGESDLFLTSTGVGIAEAVRRAYPDNAPDDPPTVWLTHVESEEVRNQLSELAMNSFQRELGAELDDAVALLHERKTHREIVKSREKDTLDDSELAEVHKRLQALKKDRDSRFVHENIDNKSPKPLI